MKKNIKWKNAVITGASSGIGLEFANQLANQGANLLLIARDLDKLKSIKNKLELSNCIKVEILSIDLTDPHSINEIISLIELRNFKPDLLINNAGLGVFGSFDNNDIEEELNIILLNIIALTKLCKSILPFMKGNKNSAILNVSSTIAFRKSPLWAVYSATKAYVLSFTQSLSFEFSESQIKFSALCPGKTKTSFDLNAGYLSKENDTKANPAYIVKYTLSKLSLGKSLIIPGLNNKLKYMIFKYLPNFFTDILIKTL